MPQIAQYDAGTNIGLQPSELGVEARANAGRAIGRSMAQTGEAIGGGIASVGKSVEQFQYHQEVSRGGAEFAKTFAGLDQQWNETIKNANPNDPSVRQKFIEETVEPTLEKMREGFGTQQGRNWADAHINQLREHFFAKTSADMSTMAGIAARTNITTLTNQLSNAAISDPSSLKTSLGLVESSINAMVDSSPNLKPTEAADMKARLLQESQATIVKAAALGAIGLNPEAGLKKFSSPEYSKYISGAELRQLEQQAKAVQRAERADLTYQKQLQNEAKRDASDQREGAYLQKLHSGDPQQQAQVSAKAIANDPTLTREARERMIGIVERETKPEAAAKVSNQTAMDLVSRIRAPAGDPNRIDSLDQVYSAYEKGQLNKADLKFVREEFANIRTPDGQALGQQQDDFIKSVKPMIDQSNPMMGKLDPSGAQQLYRFTYDLRRKVDEYRKAGKDPRDLFDPSKPDYLGSPAALQPYQKTMQQSMQDTVKRLSASKNLTSEDSQITGITVEPAKPVPQRQPGESADAYLKRLGYK